MCLETATTEISCPPLFKSTIQQELTSAAAVPALRWSLDSVKLKGNYWGNVLLAASVMHKPQSHCSHCGGNGPGQTSSAGTVGAKSQAMHCHAGVSLSCCAVPLALNYFLSLTGRETQLVPRVCRGERANTKGTATIKSRAKEASFPMDLCLASWADWPFLFSFLTSPDRPSCFPSPRISLGTYLYVSAKQSAFQVRDPGYSTDWKSKSSGCLQNTQRAWSLGLTVCVWGQPMGHGEGRTTCSTLQLPKGHRSAPSSPATDFYMHAPLSQTLKSRCWTQSVHLEKPTDRYQWWEEIIHLLSFPNMPAISLQRAKKSLTCAIGVSATS